MSLRGRCPLSRAGYPDEEHDQWRAIDGRVTQEGPRDERRPIRQGAEAVARVEGLDPTPASSHTTTRSDADREQSRTMEEIVAPTWDVVFSNRFHLTYTWTNSSGRRKCRDLRYFFWRSVVRYRHSQGQLSSHVPDPLKSRCMCPKRTGVRNARFSSPARSITIRLGLRMANGSFLLPSAMGQPASTA